MPDILHVDMDCFFAAVEVKDNPDLAGKAVIVGALPGTRGVVAACNYEARAFGVHSAMPVSKAFKKCPEGIFIKPNGNRYAEESEIIRSIFLHYTPLVEPLSLDEAFLDVSGSHRLFGTSVEIGREIKRRILDETGLVASVGVAPSKFVAKIASDLEKPDGFVVVEEDEVIDFLQPLDVRRIWGVGKATFANLQKRGIATIGDVAAFPEDELNRIFGKHGTHLHLLSLGLDGRRVVPDTERKQVSNEYTFGEDEGDTEEVERILLSLSDKVARRLMKKSLKGRKITLKLRDETFKTVTRTRTYDNPVFVGEDIYRETRELFRAEEMGGLKVRLVGVGVSGFELPEQTSLFENDSKKKNKVEEVMANIRGKFGNDSITRAALIKKKKKPEKTDDDDI